MKTEPISGIELVARLTAVLKPHGGKLVTYTLRDFGAWALTVSAKGHACLVYLSSRPVGGRSEMVVTCEPYAPADDCPAAMAASAWLAEVDPRGVSSKVRRWRLQSLQRAKS